MLCFAWTSCDDNDANMNLGNDNDTDEIVDEIPTSDVVETTMEVEAALFANNRSRMAELFVKRLNKITAAPAITESTELVMLDETSAGDFLEDEMLYGELEAFYQRGGLIYMDCPALKQAALVARLVYGTSNPVDDEFIETLYEGYLFQKDGAEYFAHDLYNPEPHEAIMVDSLGNLYTEIIQDEKEPTEYFYGQVAERAASFVNTCLQLNEKQARTLSRAGTGESIEIPIIPKHVDFCIATRRQNLNSSGSETFTAMAYMDVQMRTGYSFDENSDYYQIVLKEFFPFSQLWKGLKTRKHSIYKDKSAGGSCESIKINIQYRDNSTFPIQTVDGVIPQNQSHDGTETVTKGWEIGGNLGLSGGKGAPLVVSGGISGGYTNTTAITRPIPEMNVKYTQKSKSELYWISEMQPASMSAHFGRNPSYTAPAELATQDFFLEQAWNWIIPNTQKRGNKPFSMKIDISINTAGCSATGGSGKNKVTKLGTSCGKNWEFDLPVPGRYKHTYTIVAEPAVGSSELREVLNQNSPKFKYMEKYPERCAPTEEELQNLIFQEWQEIYEQVQKRVWGTTGKAISFYLEDEQDNRMNMKNGYKGFRLNEDGKVELVK